MSHELLHAFPVHSLDYGSTYNSSIEYIFFEMLHACVSTEEFFRVFLVVSLKNHLVWLWFSLYIKYHFLKESSFGASVHLYSNQFHFAIQEGLVYITIKINFDHNSLLYT